jgi:hypothetical protein
MQKQKRLFPFVAMQNAGAAPPTPVGMGIGMGIGTRAQLQQQKHPPTNQQSASNYGLCPASQKSKQLCDPGS